MVRLSLTWANASITRRFMLGLVVGLPFCFRVARICARLTVLASVRRVGQVRWTRRGRHSSAPSYSCASVALAIVPIGRSIRAIGW